MIIYTFFVKKKRKIQPPRSKLAKKMTDKIFQGVVAFRWTLFLPAGGAL